MPQDRPLPDRPLQDRPRARAEPSSRSRVESGAAPVRPRQRVESAELSAAEAARCAARQVTEFTCRDPEAVVAIERTDQGWRVGVEVVETRRIPDSADILAIYETVLDANGGLVSYRRVRRYSRGRTQEELR